MGHITTEKRMLTGVLLVIFVMAALFLVLSENKTNCREDEECFVSQAEKCRPAVMFQDFSGSTLKYTSENCVLVKEFDKFSEDEPLEVRELLEGKTMECKYREGDFNSILVKGLTEGIEKCEGDLKDAIYDVVALDYLLN